MLELKGTFKKIVKKNLRKFGYIIRINDGTDPGAFFDSLIETFL